MRRSKKLEIREKIEKCERADKIQTEQSAISAMKLSQIRRRIELCMREILRWNYKIYFFLDTNWERD
jgi:hypothetical protein